ncbi:MAG: methyltransferase domain-containing protein [Melioribacteraceae bacterium]|nr:methyltransferase domain-containing protein [Melioribacteraceae bacterium]
MSIDFGNYYDLSDSEIISVIDDLPLWSAPFGMKLLDTIQYKKNITVLDVGSGFGFPSVELAARLGKTSRIYCVDPWKSANARCKKKIEKWGLNNIEVLECIGEELPFDNNFFDLVISNNGLNNVNNDGKVMSEISRVTKAGCQAVFTMNLPDTMQEFYHVLKQVLYENGFDKLNHKLEEHITSKRKPVIYTAELITGNGFEIRQTIEDSFQLKYADGTSFLNHFTIRLSFREPWFNLIPDDSLRRKIFTQVETELNLIAGNKGYFAVTIPFICVDARKNNLHQ